MLIRHKILLWLFLFPPLFFGIIGFFVLVGGFIYYSRDLPPHDVLQRYEPAAVTRVHAGDGQLLAEYASQNRSFIAIEAIPQGVINAFIAAEDKNFYSHVGVDAFALLRAVIQNIDNFRKNKRLIGASTITQQVAKNFLVGNAVSLERKIREAILAFRIERSLSKDKILELYLNEIYLGYGSYGIAAASLNYFNKSLDELGVHEIAYLAALPKGPANYSPRSRKAAAIGRRNWVLAKMYNESFISRADLLEASLQDLQTYPRDIVDIVDSSYFLEETRKEAATAFGADVVNEGGLSVRTTLDTRLQRILVSSLRSGLLAYDKRHGYRGALGNIDIAKTGEEAGGGWESVLRNFMSENGGFLVDNPLRWDVGVVLGIEGSSANLGIIGVMGGDVEEGVLTLKGLSWAGGAYVNRRKVKAIKEVSQVLALGDVVFVEKQGEDYILQQVPEIEGGGIILDAHNGRVLAMVGGWDFTGSEFNRATQAKRQPGSALKPFVYLAGLEAGLTPISELLDAPFVLDQVGGGKWRPSNFSRKFYGLSPMYLGIEKSRNLMTVRLAQSLGMETIAEVASRFDIQQRMPLQLSMSLGAGETSLLQLTTAYAMLVNGGKQIGTTLIDQIQDRHGRTIFKHDARDCHNCTFTDKTESQAENEFINFNNFDNDEIEVPKLEDTRKAVTTPQAAYQTVTMLERVVTHGTGKRIGKLKLPLAGKTGTTNDSFDAWFVGFSADLAVGVFAGFDTPRTLGLQKHGGQETGSSVAVPIFKSVMEQALAKESAVPFRTPNGISFILIDDDTNKPATEKSKNTTMVAFTTEYAQRFLQNSGVTEEIDLNSGGLY